MKFLPSFMSHKKSFKPFLIPINLQIFFKSKNLNSYSILIGQGLFQNIAQDLRIGNRYLIITDSNIRNLYADRLKELFEREGKECNILSFPAGEESKSLNTFIYLQEGINLSLDRKSCIIALGGGVTGDIAGFVASTYMRGIPFVQVPTSLLAMVDSSVGGKLGINTTLSKNSVGLFSNPHKVYVDPFVLRTLPEEYLKDGLTEALKHAIIKSKKYFDFIAENTRSILSLDSQIITKLIYESIKIKISFVKADERESSRRRILNFGHTLGHAFEEVIGYGKISHGFAVSVGMVAALYISLLRNMIDEFTFRVIKNLMNHLGLPSSLNSLDLQVDPSNVYKFLKFDKKTISGTIHFILIKGIGKPLISTDITYDEIMEAIKYVC